MLEHPVVRTDALAEIGELGECTDIEAIDRLLDITGAQLVDVGCGDGALARQLAERGAQVLGLEPDPTQAALNRDAPPTPGVTLHQADGEAIPLPDSAADGVFFGRSLHHVPIERMAPVLGEARRVLRDDGGFLYVLEPVAEGTFFELMMPFHDETLVRAAAYDALTELVPDTFARGIERHYILTQRFSAFTDFVDRMMGASFNEYRREDIETDEVRKRFERARGDDGYMFLQPMRINTLLTR